MRYPEDKIKEAILHPDLEIRDRATSYFAKSYSQDPSIMDRVIEAVQTYGRQDASGLIGLSRDLPQSESSIAWVLGELNDEASDAYENYTDNLSMVLVEADTSLLLPRESAILEARHLTPDSRADIEERLRMRKWDEATCWRKLEEFCEEGKDKYFINEVNLPHAKRIVEALARFGERCEEKVHAILGQKREDYTNDPRAWMEPLVARLTGQARLGSAIPLLITKLLEDGGDLLNEECAQALTRIGSPAVLNAISKAFPGAPHHFRLYARGPLELIHSDLAVETCVDLLAQEKDTSIRIQLADSLLWQFAPEGIEAARRLLVGQDIDFELRGLRNDLLETCTFTGERFPEYDEWLAAEKAEKEEHRRQVKELEGDPTRLLLYGLEKLIGKKATDAPRAAPAVPPTPRPGPPLILKRTQRAGRNDPCPCGSGKKYKKCCGRG